MDNLVPLCSQCHTEVESYLPMPLTKIALKTHLLKVMAGADVPKKAHTLLFSAPSLYHWVLEGGEFRDMKNVPISERIRYFNERYEAHESGRN